MITLLLLYPIYKGVKELFWVKYDSYALDNKINIKVRIDESILGFQDFESDKTITIINSASKSKMEISFTSIEPDLYFYIDTINSSISLSIVDIYAGKNVYNYSTLKLISEIDCLKKNCGGYDISGFSKLGTPYLTYDDNGFHR